MGCFNKTAFYSHLPITYQDEIVVFVLAEQKCKTDSCPVYIEGNGIVPIAPPFFGKYNDYGGIEDIIDDVNHVHFTNKFGMNIHDFIDIMHDLSGITISDLKKGIEDFNNGTKRTNNYHHETLEDYEKLLSLYDNIFPKYVPDRENVSLIITMEHKSIYDKMVELGKSDYSNGWFGTYITIEEAFEKTKSILDIIKKSGQGKYKTNPLQYDRMSYIGLLYDLNIDKEFDNYDNFGCKIGFGYNIYANMLYDGFNDDIEKYREIFIDYAYFLYTLRLTCTNFNVSPYHSQDVAKQVLIPLYDKMLSILDESEFQDTNIKYIIGREIDGDIEYMDVPMNRITFSKNINNLTKRFNTTDEVYDFLDEHEDMDDCYAYRLSETVKIAPIDI